MVIFVADNVFKHKTITFQFDQELLACEKKPLIFGILFEKSIGENLIRVVPMTRAEWATIRTMQENNLCKIQDCDTVYHLRIL